MKASFAGRADLLRALAHGGDALQSELAVSLGYQKQTLTESEPLVKSRSRRKLTSKRAKIALPDACTPLAPARFWCPERFDVIKAVDLLAKMVEVKVVPRAEVQVDFEPLASFPEVLTRLRHQSQLNRPTKRPDLNRVVSVLSRGQELQRIPRMSRRSWGTNLQVIIDRSRHLTPYWDDQELIVEHLKKLLPGTGSSISILRDGHRTPEILWPEKQAWQALGVEPGATVLVLGDLGCLLEKGGSLRKARWVSLGQSWQSQGCQLLALLPCRSDTLPDPLMRVWTPIRWERSSKLPPKPSEAASEAALERLLGLSSRAVRVEPRLLRSLRHLWDEGARDCGLEARFWQRADLTSHSVAACFSAESLDPYRRKLSEDPLAAAAFDRIKAVHRDAYEGLQYMEIVNLGDEAPELADRGERERARRWLTSSDASRTEFLQTASRQLSSAALAAHPRLQQRLQALLSNQLDQESNGEVRGRSVRVAQVWQLGEYWEGAEQMPEKSGTSLLGAIRYRNKRLKIIETNELEKPRPTWASAWGSDEFGYWAEFTVADVSQRMRWIPPGQFMMGSPEEEEGRYSDEGPQHEEILKEGFWLFDSPCTQALWESVLGKNPSQFEGKLRPVEQVSWHDCNNFIKRLNQLKPGIDLCLPSEAQWEYACRAGNDDARYQNDLLAIAWYSANSNSQTHDVKGKAPNSWGLYDMLGNVYEWCGDRWRDSYSERGSTSADRVIRGGGWALESRLLRAAYRRARPPGYALGILGFRCSSLGAGPGQAGRVGAKDRSQRSGGERRAENEERSAKLRHLEVDSKGAEAPGERIVELCSDLESLTLRQIERPRWADEIGRDSFGLWASFVLKGLDGYPVTQRLRWIPPGRFYYGSPKNEKGRDNFDIDRREEIVSEGFWMFDTPCTCALWFAVMGKEDRKPHLGKEPMTGVDWKESQRFTEALNRRIEGLQLSLPNELHWEYACRAGTQGRYYGDKLDEIAWYANNSGGRAHQVKEKRPNAWGLYDMLGNVWEWCGNKWNVNNDDVSADRVVRGGGWASVSRYLRAAYRDACLPGNANGSLGFRCSSSGIDESRVKLAERGGAAEKAERDSVGGET